MAIERGATRKSANVRVFFWRTSLVLAPKNLHGKPKTRQKSGDFKAEWNCGPACVASFSLTKPGLKAMLNS